MSANAFREQQSSEGLTPEPASARAASSIFDIPIDLAPPLDLLQTVSGWAARHETRRVMYVNAHVVNQSHSTCGLRDALCRANLVYCDGYGVRLAARALHLDVPHRMTGADWIWGLAALCELSGQSIYLLGSEPPVAREAADRLANWYPKLRIAGSHHGYFEVDSPHNQRVIEDIRERAPDIVLVGMGTPKQELWVDRYADELGGAVVWTVGALFDYVSGHVPRAPRWLADHGLEWIFRLAIEPHRMWRRYLIGNPAFLSRVYHETRHHQRSDVNGGASAHGAAMPFQNESQGSTSVREAAPGIERNRAGQPIRQSSN